MTRINKQQTVFGTARTMSVEKAKVAEAAAFGNPNSTARVAFFKPSGKIEEINVGSRKSLAATPKPPGNFYGTPASGMGKRYTFTGSRRYTSAQPMPKNWADTVQKHKPKG